MRHPKEKDSNDPIRKLVTLEQQSNPSHDHIDTRRTHDDQILEKTLNANAQIELKPRELDESSRHNTAGRHNQASSKTNSNKFHSGVASQTMVKTTK